MTMETESVKNSNNTAFILGYTGETGKSLIQELNRRKLFKKIVLIGRREVQLDKDLGSEFVEVEDELKATNFDNLSIFRPGLLLCDREESRPGESCFRSCWKPMPQCIVKASAVSTDNLAKAMVYKATHPSKKVEIIENKQLYDLI